MAPRLILVSNRVNVPNSGPRQAGGLTIAVNAALKHEGVWFGWSGKVSKEGARPTPTVVQRQGEPTYSGPVGDRLSGILQRVRQPGAVADPPLPGRSGRIHFGRS